MYKLREGQGYNVNIWDIVPFTGMPTGNIYGKDVFKDGNGDYYFVGLVGAINKTYKIDFVNQTFTEKPSVYSSLNGRDCWTDKYGNVYHSSGNGQLQWDGNDWFVKTWKGLTSFTGLYVWKDAIGNIYCSGNGGGSSGVTYKLVQ